MLRLLLLLHQAPTQGMGAAGMKAGPFLCSLDAQQRLLRLLLLLLLQVPHAGYGCPWHEGRTLPLCRTWWGCAAKDSQ